MRILKLHVRNSFAHDDDAAPPSIVVTTLAARAYADAALDGGTLEQVLDLIVRAMPEMIQRRRGQIWIPTELDALRGARGLDQVANAADSILGKGSGPRITRPLAMKVQEARTAERLTSMSTTATNSNMGSVSSSTASTSFCTPTEPRLVSDGGCCGG